MSMRLLALTKNEFSSCSKEALTSFFAVICSLLQLSDVGLSCNGFLPEHAELFQNAWKMSGHSKFYVLSWCIAPPPSGINVLPPELEPQNKKLKKKKCYTIRAGICYFSLFIEYNNLLYLVLLMTGVVACASI